MAPIRAPIPPIPIVRINGVELTAREWTAAPDEFAALAAAPEAPDPEEDELPAGPADREVAPLAPDTGVSDMEVDPTSNAVTVEPDMRSSGAAVTW